MTTSPLAVMPLGGAVASKTEARCSSPVAEAEHRAGSRARVVHLRHRAISPPAGETSGFAAPDRSGCALSGERLFFAPAAVGVEDGPPWGKTRASETDRGCIGLHAHGRGGLRDSPNCS